MQRPVRRHLHARRGRAEDRLHRCVCDGHCDAACKGTADVKVKCDGKCGDRLHAPQVRRRQARRRLQTPTRTARAAATPAPAPRPSARRRAFRSPQREGQPSRERAELSYQTAIASLEANLPKILVVLQARGQDFADTHRTAAVDARRRRSPAAASSACQGTMRSVLIGDSHRHSLRELRLPAALRVASQVPAQ